MSNLVKLIIIGALIIAVPVTVKLVQQQQILKSKAALPPISDNPPNAKRPCDNAYTWKVLQPGSTDSSGHQVPQLNAGKYGTTPAVNGSPNACAVHADCPANTSDSANVDPATSNWCYQFEQGTRCIQLQHIDGQTCPGGGAGGGGGGGGSCTLGGQSPDIGATCAACLSSKTSPTNVPGVIANIKRMNSSANSCSNQQILNNWCNSFGAEAARQCNELKTGFCDTSCGGAGGGSGSGSSAGTRPDLCQSTTANKTTLNQGDSITISSTANTAVKKFMFAFFNNDNNQDGSPKLISFGGQSYTPTVELPTAQTQTSKTFNFTDLSRSDDNWGGKIPQRIQVNGYFFDSQNNQSLPKPACVANFTLAAVSTPSPSPSPSPPPNRKPGDADDNRCVNVDDYTIWKQEAGVGGTKKCANWTSENPAIVDTEDYGIWYRAWKVITNREGCITPAAGSRCIDK